MGSETLGSETLGSTVVLIVMLLLVFLAAYLTTKFLSNRGRGLAKGKYIQMKDSMYVAKDKMIALVEAGGRFYLVGISNQSMQLLGTIEKGELNPVSGEGRNAGVKASVSKFMQGVKKFTSAPEELKKAQAASKEAREYQSAWQLEQEELEKDRAAFEYAQEAGEPDVSVPDVSVADIPVVRTPGREAGWEVLSAEEEKQGARRGKRAQDVDAEETIATFAPKQVTSKRAQAKENEDEIERMMQSIEKRKAKMRKKDNGEDTRR